MDWGSTNMKMEIILKECISKMKSEAMAAITSQKEESSNLNLTQCLPKFQRLFYQMGLFT